MEPTKRAEVVSDRVRKSDLPVIQATRCDEDKMTRIHVVDDSADTVAMLAFDVKRQGYQVSTA